MLNASYLYAGDSSSFQGYGCADDEYRIECLLYANYGPETTLHDIIDELVQDSWDGPGGESFPDGCTQDAVRAALLAMLSSTGRGDYDSGAVAECSAALDVETVCPDCSAELFDDECPACGEYVDCGESPVFIVVLEYVKPAPVASDCLSYSSLTACSKCPTYEDCDDREDCPFRDAEITYRDRSRRTEGSVLVGRRDGEYYFIESVFQHRNDFRGCTGVAVYPVTQDYADELLSIDNLEERFFDFWQERFKGAIHSDCRNCRCGLDEDGCIECAYPSVKSWCQEIADVDGIDAVIDNVYDAVEALNAVCDDEVEYADCSSCGRIFSGDDRAPFDEVYNRKALVACQAYEDGAVSYEYASKIIFGRVSE